MSNPTIVLTLTALAATTLAIGGPSTPAYADSPLEERSVIVHFGDLDTNTAHDAERLYRRIKLAAESVCENMEPRRQFLDTARYATCVRAALRQAIGRLDRPLLNEYALAHGVVPLGAPIKVQVSREQAQRTPF
jgi:UrcA family protein